VDSDYFFRQPMTGLTNFKFENDVQGLPKIDTDFGLPYNDLNVKELDNIETVGKECG
jgi:hypothetical protein